MSNNDTALPDGTATLSYWYTATGEKIKEAIAVGDVQSVINSLIGVGKDVRLMGDALTEAARKDQVPVARAILVAWPEPMVASAARVAMERGGREMVDLLIGCWRLCDPKSFQPFIAWRSSQKPVPANMLGRVFGVEQIDRLVLAAAQRGERERVGWLKVHASAEGRKAAEGVLDGRKPLAGASRSPR
jgi:hypothetical protein